MRSVYYADWWCQCGKIASSEHEIPLLCPTHKAQKARQSIEVIDDGIKDQFFEVVRVNTYTNPCKTAR